MLGWYLSERRLEHIKNKKKETPSNIASMFTLTPAKQINKLFG
jgi:hypothetical protein